MAASSSANAWAFKLSSMPFVCESNLVDEAAVPNDELVEERAETPLFTLFWLFHFNLIFVGEVKDANFYVIFFFQYEVRVSAKIFHKL